MRKRTQSRVARIAVLLEGDVPRVVTTIAPGADLPKLARELLQARPSGTRVVLRNAWGEPVLEWTRGADGAIDEHYRAAAVISAPSSPPASWLRDDENGEPEDDDE
ncbi:hypothetical protein [Sandaracinus amylolyticus]|uniref:hypothetical protein n=1 Tax=Sandaracinus amylolyticus TaxID=927083 RepID=UPI001F2A307C|nr:hypothetical protein [Sandaracinus amylolyticus]UJR80610.1 Hypothetical protein I5071_26570 [Sandaracinus amylolyticus]